MTLLYKNKILLYSFIFLLGLLSSFGLPPYNFFYVNFFSYPALLWILLFYSKDKASSFYIGWIFGFGYFISNLYWITNSLTFEDIFRPLIPFALILVPLFLALFYGLSTLLFSLINPKKNILSILILMVGRVGYAPTTPAMSMQYSTIELTAHKINFPRSFSVV